MRTVILISSLFLLALVSTTKSGEKEFIEATKRIPCFMISNFYTKDDYRIALYPDQQCLKDEMIQVYKKGLKMMCDSRFDFGLANRQFTIIIFDPANNNKVVVTEACK
jgi:hypothetical protein